MKKTYIKPQVYFEDFQLSASFAGDCTGDNKISLNHSKESCAYEVPGTGTYFVERVCTIPPDPEGSCEQRFMDESKFFAS